MARIFSSDFTAEKNKSFARTFPSAVFHFGGAVGDIYVSEFDMTIAGNAHQGCVKDWGEYSALSQIRDGAFSVASMRLSIINHPLFGAPAKRFSDLWSGIGVEGVEVDVYQNFLKTDSPGTVYQALMSSGVMRPHDYWPDLAEVEVAPISEKYLDTDLADPVNQTDYPNADPDDIGKPGNRLYGAVKKVRADIVSIGLKSTVRSSMATGATAITVHDNFYDLLPSTGSVIIGTETIAYTAKAGSAGSRTLTCSATTKTHNKDDTIIQVVSSWIFRAAIHPMTSMGTVYVKRGDKLIPLAAAQYTVNLNNTTLVSGKALTTITFTSPPLVAEKDDVAIDNSSNEQQWQQDGSDQNITSFGTGTIDAGACQTTAVALTFPAQDKTKSSGNYTKRLTVSITSAGQPTAAEIQLVHDGDSCPTPEILTLQAGQDPINLSPQIIESGHWNLAIRRKNVSGSQISVAAITVAVSAKTESYKILSSIGLSSTSTADNPIGEIYFDGEGYADDGSGTYTGSANALIEKPADVYHHLVRVPGGVPAGRVDAASFQQARSDSPSSYKLSGNFIERFPTLKPILLGGLAARLKFDWPADKLTCRFLKSSYTSGGTIAESQVRSIETQDGPKTTLRMSHSPIEELVNEIMLRYGRDWSMARGKDAYTKTSQDSDATSIAKYLTHKDDERFWCDFIAASNSAMADDLVAFWKLWLKEPARIASFEAFLDLLDLLPGDCRSLDYLVGTAEKFDGLAGSNKFTVEEVKMSPNAPAQARAPLMRFKLREAP